VERERPKSILITITLLAAVGDAVDNSLHSLALGLTEVRAEHGRLVVTMTAAFSARSAMTWNTNSPPTSASGAQPNLIGCCKVIKRLLASQGSALLQPMLGPDHFVVQRGCAGGAHPALSSTGGAGLAEVLKKVE
jgi:hypothetical protein